MRHVALLSGGDWADASVGHIQVPDDLDLASSYKAYRSWLKNEYSKKVVGYLTFLEWLVKNANCIEDTDIEYFDEAD